MRASERLKADPRAAVAEETGITAPKSVAIDVSRRPR